MGLLRLYLALCVVGVHSGAIFPWSTHDGHQAVQIFFLISGFYMQMVYSSNYASAKEFYASRFLRIFIPYWIILALTVATSLIAYQLEWQWIWTKLHPYFNQPLQHNGVESVVLVGLSNLTLFFQDWVMFLTQDAGQTLAFTNDFRESKSPLYQYLLIPQAWTIGLELTFYLMVPILSKLRSRTLLYMVATSLIARIIAYEAFDLDRDPWEYRFFPFELALFLLGMLSYRLSKILPYQSIQFQPSTTVEYCIASLVLMISFAAASKALEILGDAVGYHYAVLLSYLVWAIAIPALFQIFGKWKHDRFIGELSYPIYLGHLIVVSIAIALMQKMGFPTALYGPICAFLSIVFACALYIFILRPIETKRHVLAKKLARQMASERQPSS